MAKDKYDLYKDSILILSQIELVLKDKKAFEIIRKRILDLANDILKLDGDSYGN